MQQSVQYLDYVSYGSCVPNTSLSATKCKTALDIVHLTVPTSGRVMPPHPGKRLLIQYVVICGARKSFN